MQCQLTDDIFKVTLVIFLDWIVRLMTWDKIGIPELEIKILII
jgi:hypothetical protein